MKVVLIIMLIASYDGGSFISTDIPFDSLEACQEMADKLQDNYIARKNEVGRHFRGPTLVTTCGWRTK